jgi:hypothetical protein
LEEEEDAVVEVEDAVVEMEVEEDAVVEVEDEKEKWDIAESAVNVMMMAVCMCSLTAPKLLVL